MLVNKIKPESYAKHIMDNYGAADYSATALVAEMCTNHREPST
jgi:hypothetical protein